MKERTVGIAVGIALSAISILAASMITSVFDVKKKKPVTKISDTDIMYLDHLITFSECNTYPCEYYILRKKSTEMFFDKDDRSTIYTKCGVIKVKTKNCDQVYIVIQPGKTKRGGGLFPIVDVNRLEQYHMYFGVTHQELVLLHHLISE